MSTSPDAPTPHVGMLIAQRYRLDEHRAHGGMADVWRAHDLQLDRTVAVKLLKPNLATESTVAERFRREAKAAASLTHPNIVTVFDAVEDHGRQAVIMEFIEGVSLRELLDQKHTLSPSMTVRIGKSVCAALDEAHSKKVIHRDVKPGNVLIETESLRIKLTDCGIAKALGEAGEDLTSENIMMGTAKYLAPEQVQGDELDGRADIYSLGLVLYECLVGKVPFLGSNDTETALARLRKDPERITVSRPDVSPALSDVIHRMMDRRVDRRYATGAEARAALHSAPSERTNGDRTPTPGRVIRPRTGNTPPGGTTRDPSPVAGRQPSNSRPVPRSPHTSTHGWKPKPPVIVGAIVALLILGVIIAKTSGGSTGDAGTTPAVTATPSTLYTGPVSITGVQSFDPEGDDGGENDDQVAFVTDGDPATVWTSSCYKSSTFGSKSGVGLVVQLNESALAQISVDMAESGWSARVYSADEAGASLADWGSPIWEGGSDGGEGIVATFSSPSRYALVFITEVGRSGFCSNKNPFRASVSDIRVTLAP